ncbi:MAG TPA: hypothetical protein VM123_13010 [archaeon]|nr:hypothetical protein [archaeon]
MASKKIPGWGVKGETRGIALLHELQKAYFDRFTAPGGWRIPETGIQRTNTGHEEYIFRVRHTSPCGS